MNRTTLVYTETNVPVYQDVDGSNWEKAAARAGDICTGCDKAFKAGESCFENGEIALLCSDCVEIVPIEELWRAYDYAGKFFQQGKGIDVRCPNCREWIDEIAFTERGVLALVRGHWVNKHPYADAAFFCPKCDVKLNYDATYHETQSSTMGGAGSPVSVTAACWKPTGNNCPL
jgi:hypothetical protein